MSRIGKKIIKFNDKTEVSFSEGVLKVKGINGELSKKFRPEIEILINNNEIISKPLDSSLKTNALWGSYSSIINSMIKGVNEFFVKKIILEGIGYKSEVKGEKLHLALGFSHPVEVNIPKTLKVSAEKNIISVFGINKEEVGLFSANLRALKKPEPYKGKGFRYEGEIIKRKQGKKTT